jgi:RNA polymerase sigma-70 factor (ECF subfamily)
MAVKQILIVEHILSEHCSPGKQLNLSKFYFSRLCFMKSSIEYVQYDDEKLISLIAQLQEGALTQLYERYKRVIFSLALAIVNDQATAEEVTLDVFLRVWQKAGSYRADQAKVSTWLTHIARHHAIDVLRRRAARPDQYAVSLDDVAYHGDSSEQDPQAFAEVSARRERVHIALAKLPTDQKQALILAYFGGYTQHQISEKLKQPLGTVKTRLRLALQKLRDFLREEAEIEDKSVEPASAYNITKDER